MDGQRAFDFLCPEMNRFLMKNWIKVFRLFHQRSRKPIFVCLCMCVCISNRECNRKTTKSLNGHDQVVRRTTQKRRDRILNNDKKNDKHTCRLVICRQPFCVWAIFFPFLLFPTHTTLTFPHTNAQSPNRLNWIQFSKSPESKTWVEKWFHCGMIGLFCLSWPHLPVSS